MISHTQNCIFIHIPKTAGTSIEKLIKGNYKKKTWISHKKLEEYRDSSGFDSYFKFSFVRNPYARVLSIFNYYKHGGNDRGLFYKPDKIYNYAIKKLTTNKVLDIDISKKMPKNFDKFCEYYIKNKKGFYGRNALDSQLSFLEVDNQINIDFIGKFENLNKDIAIIKDRLGIYAELEHQRKSKSLTHYSNCYNNFTRKIIKEAYEKELEYFKYKFDEIC